MPTILHVGCGGKNKSSLPRHFQGDAWQEIRLDIDPKAQPDIVASMLDMQGVVSASMDAVFSSHNLEHLYPHEVGTALAEFRRVLKADGMAVITLPDLQAVAELIAADKLDDPAYVSPAGPIAPLDMLYGFRPALARGNLYMAHRTGFTARTLGQALLRAGFQKVALQRQRAAFNLWAIAYVGDITEDRLAAEQKGILPLPARPQNP